MTPGGMNRREAVRRLAALAAACGTGTVAGAAACPPWLGADALEGAKQMGRAFLDAHAADPGIAQTWALAQDESALDTLVQMVQQDYERGHIEHLAGWYVSRTEARIFAAIATSCS